MHLAVLHFTHVFIFVTQRHRGTDEAFLSHRGAEEAEAQSLLIASSRHPDQGGSAAEIPERHPDIPTSRNSGTLSPRLSGACGRAVGASLPVASGLGRFHETPATGATSRLAPLRPRVGENRGESGRIEVIDYV